MVREERAWQLRLLRYRPPSTEFTEFALLGAYIISDMNSTWSDLFSPACKSPQSKPMEHYAIVPRLFPFEDGHWHAFQASPASARRLTVRKGSRALQKEKKKMRTALARHSNEPYFCLTALPVSFFQFIKAFILFRRKAIALWCLGPAAGRIFSSMRHAVSGGALRRRLAKASANRENKRKMLRGNCVFFLEWRGVLSGCYRKIKCGPCWLLKKRRKRNRRKECKSSLIQSRKESVGGERGSLSAWPKSRMKSTRGGRRR